MYIGENNGNLSETKNMFSLSARFPALSQNEKIFAWYENEFLIMSNFYLVEILSEPNSLTIVTSKKILKMSDCVLILSIFYQNENQEFPVLIRKKYLDCVSLWVNCVIWNVVIKIRGKKGSKFACCKWNVHRCVLFLKNLPCPEKRLVERLVIFYYFW